MKKLETAKEEEMLSTVFWNVKTSNRESGKVVKRRCGRKEGLGAQCSRYTFCHRTSLSISDRSKCVFQKCFSKKHFDCCMISGSSVCKARPKAAHALDTTLSSSTSKKGHLQWWAWLSLPVVKLYIVLLPTRLSFPKRH